MASMALFITNSKGFSQARIHGLFLLGFEYVAPNDQTDGLTSGLQPENEVLYLFRGVCRMNIDLRCLYLLLGIGQSAM